VTVRVPTVDYVQRDRVVKALRSTRSECHANGHGWDVADVMEVLDKEGLFNGANHRRDC
jgi:hypothetical protein